MDVTSGRDLGAILGLILGDLRATNRSSEQSVNTGLSSAAPR
jgi:hypothetical protein